MNMKREYDAFFVALVLFLAAALALSVGIRYELSLANLLSVCLAWLSGFVVSMSRINELHQRIIDLQVDIIHRG